MKEVIERAIIGKLIQQFCEHREAEDTSVSLAFWRKDIGIFFVPRPPVEIEESPEYWAFAERRLQRFELELLPLNYIH